MKCEECGAEAPAHYGSCSNVPAEMKGMLADLDREAAERRAKQPDNIRAVRRHKAKVVSEALLAVSKHAFNTSIQRSRLWAAVAQCDEEELLMLGRLLK